MLGVRQITLALWLGEIASYSIHYIRFVGFRGLDNDDGGGGGATYFDTTLI
jgi:hypothetical protein